MDTQNSDRRGILSTRINTECTHPPRILHLFPSYSFIHPNTLGDKGPAVGRGDVAGLTGLFLDTLLGGVECALFNSGFGEAGLRFISTTFLKDKVWHACTSAVAWAQEEYILCLSHHRTSLFLFPPRDRTDKTVRRRTRCIVGRAGRSGVSALSRLGNCGGDQIY